MMSRIQQLSAFGLFTLLVTVAAARGHRFSGWSEPMNLGPVVNSDFGDFYPTISKNGLSLYFTSSRTNTDAQGRLPQGGSDIYVSQRKSAKDDWGAPYNLGPVINTPFDESGPSLSIDGRRMYFASNRPYGFGGNDIYVSRRHHTRDDFGWELPYNVDGGTRIDSVNTEANEANPAIFEDERTGAITLYFDSNRPGPPGTGPFTDDIAHNGNDVYASVFESKETFGPATLIAELVGTRLDDAGRPMPALDRQPAIRRDGLEIFFASNRSPGYGALDLWVSTRATTADSWLPPVNLGSSINSIANEAGPALSFDATMLYFQSVRPIAPIPFDLIVTTRSKLKGQGRDHKQD